MFAEKISEQEGTGKRHISFIEICTMVTCAFWLSAKIISYKVWGTDRLFPIAPVSDIFLFVPAVVHDVLFYISVVCLCIGLITPKQKKILVLLLICELLSCLLDQNRWQPWEYQFMFTIAILWVYHNKKVSMRACIMFVLASTYI